MEIQARKIMISLITILYEFWIRVKSHANLVARDVLTLKEMCMHMNFELCTRMRGKKCRVYAI